MAPNWTAQVSFRDAHAWGKTVALNVTASNVWHAARQAVQHAKGRLPRGYRIQEVVLKLQRSQAVRP